MTDLHKFGTYSFFKPNSYFVSMFNYTRAEPLDTNIWLDVGYKATFQM